ncbi:hypothetical protein A0H76_2076 [Hepatospora eriocheir]|uniref:Methionyl/Leucyl tRNA synthetase domain-containing protein n=1 Tax=Hepatospora eriocheir TaxID=1081669 RepID=A0A1X0QFX0_9MICR|nr:hypothetical protein A0H76_2076 [Hepatospora eriocheir]
MYFFDIIKKNRQIYMNVYSMFDYFEHNNYEEHRNLVQEFFLIINYFKQIKVYRFYCETFEQFLANRYMVRL